MKTRSCFNCAYCEIFQNKRAGKCVNTERQHVQYFNYQIVYPTQCCGDYWEPVEKPDELRKTRVTVSKNGIPVRSWAI